MSDRVTVYRFGKGRTAAACAMLSLLIERGLHPHWDFPSRDDYDVTLPASEVPALRALQQAEPERFGGC